MTLDQIIDLLREGKAELAVFHNGKRVVTWGVGSDHAFWLTGRQWQSVRQRVKLVESESTRKLTGTPFCREYAAEGHKTWNDLHAHDLKSPTAWTGSLKDYEGVFLANPEI